MFKVLRGTALAAALAMATTQPLAAQSQPVMGQQPVKVAAVDFVPAWGDLDGNVRRLVEAAEEVSRQGIQYAVFPETAVSGYLFSGPEQIAPFLDTIPERRQTPCCPFSRKRACI